MHTVAVIDYGSGNLRSAAKALEQASLHAGKAFAIRVTSDAEDVARADRVMLPGVGAFGDCMAGLTAVDGMVDALNQVRNADTPFLGICVGMQLMALEGLEHGTTKGLGWVDGVVEPLKPTQPSMKIPHMGWNVLDKTAVGQSHPLLDGVALGAHTYFVHSYHMTGLPESACLAQADYGGPVAAIIGDRAAAGTQFHPEKSQTVGLQILTNFLTWQP